MIHIENLEVIYDNTIQALDHISLTLSSKRIAIVGANGSGKSTLLSSIVGLVETKGLIEVNGLVKEEENLKEIRRQVGFLFQNPDHQLFMNTVREDIGFGLVNLGIEADEIKKRVDKIAFKLSIDTLLERSPVKLSGGQKSLCALAGLLVMNPDILLLDEPTAYLDPRARRTIINILKKCETQMIFATHDLDLAYELADEVIIINKGKIIKTGSRDLLKEKELLEENSLELPLRFQED